MLPFFKSYYDSPLQRILYSNKESFPAWGRYKIGHAYLAV